MERIKLYLCLFLLYAGSVAPAAAQQNPVQSAEKTIQKMPRKGLQTSIQMDESLVNDTWESYLKKFGRVESSKRVYTMENAKIPALSDKPVRVISTVEENKGTCTIFCAFDLGTAYVTSGSSGYAAAESFMQQFIRQVYEAERDARLRVAEKALAEAVRGQEKRTNEGESLVRAQERNRNEKANLERKLQENKQEAEQLVKDVDTNKREQQAAAQEVEQKRRAVEEVKAKYAFVGAK
ncbi:MAG: hypothetical protein AVDCRST_MAG56-2819 [uncultured Cytophagales bacterium]|uniref:Uncharacterized protein n=1 Tax=uncultured Cytophagales bacterium TaxID=158755 RepID=A0A6J4J3C3_9SPHI|nr:MAG: hypothetical protein AVDCRST_MAG56-2819 [uncultured Cytophagales bacterium]